MNSHINTGQAGESLAVMYLQKKGYTIVETNYRYKRSEVDIIASKANVLVFVEVKTRRTAFYGLPEESVDIRKMEKLMEAAEHYVEEHQWNNDIRFDVISISLGKNYQIKHLEDVFY